LKKSGSHGGTEVSENELSSLIVDSAVELNRNLGTELLETIYEITAGD
jgi:hypothetical protein